jgi:hypothetical protein
MLVWSGAFASSKYLCNLQLFALKATNKETLFDGFNYPPTHNWKVFDVNSFCTNTFHFFHISD